MILHPTELPGVMLIELECHADERGSFTRTFDAEVFARHGLSTGVLQCSISRNTHAGTLRGLHHQLGPHAEGKLVRCARGRIYDVVVDLRADSPSYRQWIGVELGDTGLCSIFVAPGCAHGFQTLVDESEVCYQIDSAYKPEAARGIRWNDPAFAIDWPAPPPRGRTISARDGGFPDYLPGARQALRRS